MDRQEAPAVTAPGSPPQPQDFPDFIPIGSPDDALPEVLSPVSDEDHEDHDHDQEDSSGASILTADDIKQKIIKQVEYYFSDKNLPTDKYLLNLIRKHKQGYVPIPVIASFRKMKKVTRDLTLIAAALKESSLLVVSSDGKKVKRSNPLPVSKARDSELFTVLVENLPEDHSVGNLQRIFGAAGSVKNICIHDPHAIEESKKGGKTEILISNKLHALVEYDNVEAAEKAAATLNNEHDWRNGMRVKLLKLVGKYGQHRKQALRGPDSTKNGNGHGRPSNNTGDDENNRSNDNHDNIPHEEDGENTPNDNSFQRGKSRGRGRRQKYRSSIGHGTTSSVQGVEPSKPPPGPKMPDGTRGFAMGRGRPLVSNQS